MYKELIVFGILLLVFYFFTTSGSDKDEELLSDDLLFYIVIGALLLISVIVGAIYSGSILSFIDKIPAVSLIMKLFRKDVVDQPIQMQQGGMGLDDFDDFDMESIDGSVIMDDYDEEQF